MEEVLPISAKETLEIIWNSDISIYEKIPPKLICLLRELASKCTENVELLDNTPIMEQPITEDAKAIIALIYKDCIASPDERNRLNNIYIKKDENEFVSENIFKKDDVDFVNKEQEVTSLIKLKNEK